MTSMSTNIPGGKREQNHRLDPAFRRQGFDLAAELVALADDAGELVEQLGQVAAGLLLDQKREHEDLELDQAGAACQLAESDLGREAEVLLLVAIGELAGNRRCELVGDRLDALGHGLPPRMTRDIRSKQSGSCERSFSRRWFRFMLT